MTNMNTFWDTIGTQLEALKSATSADDVLRILSHDRNPDRIASGSPADAFFAGSGGDGTVRESLIEAGWVVLWAESSHYYVLRAPDGSTVTYIEGDIYRGDRRAPSDAR